MKKVLFVATVTRHIIGFHMPYLKLFKENGYEVHVASLGKEKIEYCDKHFNIPFTRSPFTLSNIKAYKQLKKIIDKNNYEIIHCHTPVGGVLTRFAAKYARENGTRVIYTAHGFHFYKGAPLKNWLIYYPIEKYFSKYTDYLITINNEDYEIAKSKFKAKKVEYLHGIGVDENKFAFDLSEAEKNKLKEQIGVKKDDFLILCIGELNNNKNQIVSIEAMQGISREHKNIKLLLAGNGPNLKFYEQKIREYNLEDNIKLLGYRRDIPKLLKISNLVISTSKREGLPVNVIEAMMCGLPVIGTNCRGNRDLIDKANLVEINDIEKLKAKILNVKKTSYDISEYKLEKVITKMKGIYEI